MSVYLLQNPFMAAATPHDLLRILRQRHVASAREVRMALEVSAPTLSRLVRSMGEEILTIGRARRSSYAARRSLRGSFGPLPLYAVDSAGRADHVAQLHLGYPDGTLVEPLRGLEWPLASGTDRMQDGWFEGVPYFLQDMRPQGFLGRGFARMHAALLQVSEDPERWSDDDSLYALSLLGADQSGNFIIGDAAFRLWQDGVRQERAVGEGESAAGYVALAQQAMSYGLQGSSAGGEFPKFSALRERQGDVVHVLVKFSGSDESPGTRRWSDLLVCEHIAAETVGALEGLRGARSRILSGGGRTFLEVERFDRNGARGRSGLCSWAAINGDWFGLSGKPWTEAAAAMRRDGLINEATRQAITRLHFFGRLIGNTDMHDGNMSFEPIGIDSVEGNLLRLSPVYDMLPMAYRPQVGVELAEVNFKPALPLPAERELWSEAASAAALFWQRAAGDQRITRGFRTVCARNADLVIGAGRRA
jgi:hypothetical protein